MKALLLYGPFTATIECSNDPPREFKLIAPTGRVSVENVSEPSIQLTFKTLKFDLVFMHPNMAIYEFDREA